MTRAAFIVNAQAGGARDPGWLEANRQLVERIANGGPVRFVRRGEEIVQAVQQALDARCSAIVAGGGDGTVNAVASVLVGSPATLGVLPLGTLNHFAKDLGIPLEPAQALAAIAEGHRTAVDVGEVNGRYFVNTSSLGLYPDIVRHRERQQRWGRGKWTAFMWALWTALRRYPFLKVRLSAQGESTVHRTPFVFVGNNAYGMQGLRIGGRARLDKGVLSVCVADNPSRARLLTLAVRAVLGRLQQARDLCAFEVQQLAVETHHRQLRVAIDGEVQMMRAPFHYRIHAEALRVFVPKPRESHDANAGASV